MQSKKIANFRNAELFKDIKNGITIFRLVWKGKLVATDRQFKYLNQIMYQIG